MIGAEANRRNGWCEEEAEEDGQGAQGVGWKVAADLGERSNSDRKFLYGVQCAAHSQLEARNRLVFANRARPTSRRATRAGELQWYVLRRARCPNSPLRFRDFRFGISMFTAPPDTQSSVETALFGSWVRRMHLYYRLCRYCPFSQLWVLSILQCVLFCNIDV